MDANGQTDETVETPTEALNRRINEALKGHGLESGVYAFTEDGKFIPIAEAVSANLREGITPIGEAQQPPDSAKERYDRILETLTDPKPPLSVGDMMMLAEHYMISAVSGFNMLMEDQNETPDANTIATGLALISIDVNLGRGFIDLARLKMGKAAMPPDFDTLPTNVGPWRA